MRTRLTRRLGIVHPIVQAGMGGVARAELVAAVSQAGGLGQLAAFAMTPKAVAAELARIKALTSKPFAVNVLAAGPGGKVLETLGRTSGDPDAELLEIVDMAMDAGAVLIVSALGLPLAVAAHCRSRGVLVGNMCGAVAHAQRAVEAGCDVVIAQGTEAGGHTGTIGTMALVPQVVDAVGDRALVLAAGGIFDGRGMVAALALGADGVVVGTRFAATPEAREVPGYKSAVLAARETSTVVTRAYSGKTMRALRNDYTDYFEAHPDELLPFPAQMAKSSAAGHFHFTADTDVERVDQGRECYPLGQAAGAIRELVSAGDVVMSIGNGADRVLASISADSQ